MIKIYNTMTREKETFETVEPRQVSMYVCGPTVYNYIHVGNARTFITFDMVRRFLTWRGYDVEFVQNVTDVDDKIIAKSLEEGISAEEVAKRYTQAFIEDMRSVGVLDPDIRPKATEEIPVMIALIERLIEQGHAYAVEGDVYFAVESFSEYGALSNRKLEDMESGHRELRSEDQDKRKRGEFDFAMWKAAKPGEPAWDSPWGQGRPGWHIECSAMSEKYLGLPFDIHGGGADLMFPHHENERAQSEAACGCRFANYWMHGGMLQINSEKMSKSEGNFLLLRDILKRTDAPVLRMLMLQTHYRSPLDFSDERLIEADTALQRIENAANNLKWLGTNAKEGQPEIDGAALKLLVKDVRDQFIAAMEDDFNTAESLGAIFTFVNESNALLADKSATIDEVDLMKLAYNTITELVGVLGLNLRLSDEIVYPQEVVALAIDLANYAGDSPEQAVEALLAARANARAEKDWGLADKVRDGFAGLGLMIEDTPQGSRVYFK